MASAARIEVKESLKLAVPVMFTQVGNMSMGLVDSFVVGNVSSTELAAVAAGNGIFWTCCIIGIGLLFGMDPIISQAYGRDDGETCNRSLAQTLALGLVLSLLFVPLLLIIANNYHHTGADPAIVASAVPYLEVIAWSFPLVFLFSCFQRYWQGLGIAVPIMIIIIVANVINYFVDVALVRGEFGFPAMGATGVAYSTLVCRIFTFIAILAVSFYFWRRKHGRQFQALQMRHLWPFDRALFSSFLRLGMPAATQVALEVFAFNITTILIARLGTIELATHHIVLSIASFTFMFPLGLSSATAVRVGFHTGKGSQSDCRYAGWLGIRLGTLIMVGFGLMLYIIPDSLIGIFTSDLEVLHLGRDIIFLCALFQVFDGLQVVTAGALRGIGDTKTPLYANLLSHYFIGLPLGLSLCFWWDYGLWGLWVGLATGLLLVSVINLYFWSLKSKIGKSLVHIPSSKVL